MSTRALTEKHDPRFKPQTVTDDRRRRPRLVAEAVGYLVMDDYATDLTEPTEVRVQDVSRLGVGFLTKENLRVGSICRIRIGYGPMRLARRMRVQRCEEFATAVYLVGAEFA